MPDITKSSLRYTLLYKAVKLFFNLFYRRITVTGSDKIPLNVPVIFASNHQNALMDALAMLFAANRPVVFLARADIFKNKRVAQLLNFLKIFPVYRIRDGIETMGNNSLIFNKTVQVLQSNTPLGILPEGTHTNIKHLQPLKKGICRIAFQTAESSNFSLNIHIVPVGLDYTNYQNAGTHLLVNYGEPIEVAGYYDLYCENPQKAISKLRDDLAVSIRKIMIHVENVEFYKPITILTDILIPGYLNVYNLIDNRLNRFTASREIISRIETAATQNRINLPVLRETTNNYTALLEKYKLRNKLLESPPPSIWMLLISTVLSFILLPLHLYGMIFNYLPYKMPFIISRKIKDSQFISSVNFGLGFVLFLFWYLILMVLMLVLSGSIIATLFAVISWPVAGLFTFYHYIHCRKLFGRFRYFILKNRHPEQLKRFVDLRQQMLNLADFTVRH